jgi:hypothetical protein
MGAATSETIVIEGIVGRLSGLHFFHLGVCIADFRGRSPPATTASGKIGTRRRRSLPTITSPQHDERSKCSSCQEAVRYKAGWNIVVGGRLINLFPCLGNTYASWLPLSPPAFPIAVMRDTSFHDRSSRGLVAFAAEQGEECTPGRAADHMMH